MEAENVLINKSELIRRMTFKQYQCSHLYVPDRWVPVRSVSARR